MGLESPVRGKGQGRLRQITSVAKTHLGTMFGRCVFSLGLFIGRFRPMKTKCFLVRTWVHAALSFRAPSPVPLLGVLQGALPRDLPRAGAPRCLAPSPCPRTSPTERPAPHCWPGSPLPF